MVGNVKNGHFIEKNVLKIKKYYINLLINTIEFNSKNKNMHFPWKQEYEMGIKVIDNQHREFIGIINELYDSILARQTNERLEEILSKLIDYAVNHFDTEEKYFNQFHYDGADEHKAKHKELKEKVLDFQNRFHENKIELSFDLIDFLEDWLTEHLIDMDFKYKECFKNNGL